MKGFARILESIVASIIILTSLTFFFIETVPDSQWEDSALQVISQDVLQSSYFSGDLKIYVQNDDSDGLNTYLSNILPKTIDFSVNVKGIPNNIIYVGCVSCGYTDLLELNTILDPLDFTYKGRPTSIRITNVSTDDIPEETNIVFFFYKLDIEPNKIPIENFVEDGGTVILLSNLAQADIEGYIGQLFNLTWAGIIGSDTAIFYEVFDPGNVSHYAARYYAGVNQTDLVDMTAVQFNGFNSNGVLAIGDGKDMMSGLDPVNRKTYVRARGNAINGNGRAIWFGDYVRVDHNSTNTRKIDDLLKSAVMWGSGESYSLDTVTKTPAPIHFASNMIIFDNDPYVFELILWRVFY